MSRRIICHTLCTCLVLNVVIITHAIASPRLSDHLDEYRPTSAPDKQVAFMPKIEPGKLGGEQAETKKDEVDLIAFERDLYARVKTNPSDIRSLQDYGFFLLNINQRGAGLRYLDQAIQLSEHPHQKTNIILGIARFDIAQGTQGGARQIISTLLENPTLPKEFAAEAHFLMGLSYYKDVFFDSAPKPKMLASLQQHWRRTLSLEPNYTDWRDSRWNRRRIERVLNSVQSGRRSPHGPGGFAH